MTFSVHMRSRKFIIEFLIIAIMNATCISNNSLNFFYLFSYIMFIKNTHFATIIYHLSYNYGKQLFGIHTIPESIFMEAKLGINALPGKALGVHIIPGKTWNT